MEKFCTMSGEFDDIRPYNDAEVDALKREKLRLKDEIYAFLAEYKKENNL